MLPKLADAPLATDTEIAPTAEASIAANVALAPSAATTVIDPKEPAVISKVSTGLI
jgi:hypothetical protein